jgi:hypothetical protein
MGMDTEDDEALESVFGSTKGSNRKGEDKENPATARQQSASGISNTMRFRVQLGAFSPEFLKGSEKSRDLYWVATSKLARLGRDLPVVDKKTTIQYMAKSLDQVSKTGRSSRRAEGLATINHFDGKQQ